MQPRIYDKVGYTLIKTFTCNKLSDRAKGQLHYQLWQSNDDQSFGLALSKNESSGGFSAELIKVEDILSLLATLYQSAKPFHAISFKGLFVGRSANNASFLGAILVDQGVIHLHPQTARLLEVNTEYELWPLSFEKLLLSNNETSAEVDASEKPSNKRGPKTKTSTELEDGNAVHQDAL